MTLVVIEVVHMQRGMTTGGKAKQPTGLRETGQEKEGDKTELPEGEEMN